MHAADMFFVIKELQKSECEPKSTGCQRKRNKNSVLATIWPACTRPLSTWNSGAPCGVNCCRGCVLGMCRVLSTRTTRGWPSWNRRTFCKSNTIYIYIYIHIYINASRTDSPPAPRMDGPEAPQVLGWQTCLKNFQASLPSTPSKSSNHTKRVFQANLSSKSSNQAPRGRSPKEPEGRPFQGNLYLYIYIYIYICC